MSGRRGDGFMGGVWVVACNVELRLAHTPPRFGMEQTRREVRRMLMGLEKEYQMEGEVKGPW